MIIDWNVVRSEINEDGIPTLYQAKVGNNIIYIERNYKGKYGVSNTLDPDVPYLVECKTWESARRWVSRYRDKLANMK